MFRYLQPIFLCFVLIVCLAGCKSDKSQEDPEVVDAVQIHFSDKKEVKTYKQNLEGGKPALGSERLSLQPYTEYEVKISPMMESGGKMIDQSEYWNQRLDSVFVLFENFDVGINYSRADMDSRSLPSGLLSKIRTFAPGQGTLHFTVKKGVLKTQPYQSGEKIIDITIPVSIE